MSAAELVEGPEGVIARAHALLDAINWDPRGVAGLTHRARGTFSDLAVASGWKASPRPSEAGQ